MRVAQDTSLEMQIDLVDDLKQPEYTGENRCEPCTVLNLVIAAAISSAVARKSRLGGLLAAGISIALIYLRGYLVPGTPTLTKRYLPPEVLRWFGKEPEPAVASGLGAVDPDAAAAVGSDRDRTDSDATDGSSGAGDVATFDEDDAVDTADTTDASAVAGDGGDEQVPRDLETFFLEHDVLEPCADRDDLCLTEEFETAWFDEIDPLDEAGVDAATAVAAFGFDDLDVDPDEFELAERDEVRVLFAGSSVAGRWPSRAALLADVAASRALESRIDDWETIDPETKGEVLNGLRMFLERCPTGGDVQMNEEVVESCCTSHEVVAVTCTETGERLFEQRLVDVDADA